MEEIYQSNFFDLFEFTIEDTFATRVNLQVDGEFYHKGFIFNHNDKCGGWDLYRYINHIALIKYNSKLDYWKLVFFSPKESSNKLISYVQPEIEIYRFSKLEYLEKSLLQGTFLLRPSIYYLKNEHCKARLDNEHINEKLIGNAEVESITKNGWHKVSDLRLTQIDSNLNQYMLCFSYSYDTRLYKEFEGSDACLVITNVDEFYKRIEKELKGYLCISKRVSYSTIMDNLGLMFTKDINYFIQKEYRYVWTNSDNPIFCNPQDLFNSNMKNIEELIPNNIEISIGSIEDIAYILDKEGNKILF